MTRPIETHIAPDEAAAHVDGALTDAERAAVDAHLATCAECRAEVLDVRAIVRTAPTAGIAIRRTWIPVVAAAAVVLIWLAPQLTREETPSAFREETVTLSGSPSPVAPLGAVDSVPALMWTSVPAAETYRLRLFTVDGTLLWEAETGDTLLPLPDSVALAIGSTYHWRVEASSGFERWVSSDLVEFRVEAARTP